MSKDRLEDNIKNSLEDKETKLKDSLKDKETKLKDSLKDKEANLKENLKDQEAKLKSSLEEKKEEIKEKAGNQQAVIKEKLEGQGEKIKGKVEEIDEKRKSIKVSDHFTVGKMIRYTLLPIFSLLCTSLYSVVDGWFIVNFTDEISYAAVNMMSPYIIVFPTVGFMLGTGGSALISMVLGQGNKERASQIFSMILQLGLILAIIMTALEFLLMDPFVDWQKANAALHAGCMAYGKIILIGTIFSVFQYAFQSFLVMADKQKLAFAATILAGLTNMVFDAIFIIVFKWGLTGAAAASVMGEAVAAIIPAFFIFKGKVDQLKYARTRMEVKVLTKVCSNGASEMLSYIASSVVGMLYNYQLNKLAGENGINAYGTLMYFGILFLCIFTGFDMEAVPVIGYQYGADNKKELKNLFKVCYTIVGACCLIIFASSFFGAEVLCGIFVRNHPDLYEMTVRACRIYSPMYLFAGLNIMASALFTALNNGLVSAIISMVRSLILPVILVFSLPLIWGLDGVWISSVASEIGCFILSLVCIFAFRKKYDYL